jgi:hypothetical protein
MEGIMTEPSLALQRALRARLAGSSIVTALVPAANIIDRNERPERFPAIILGDGVSSYADIYETFHDRAFADLHLWTAEAGTAGVKEIAGAIRDALRHDRLVVEGFDCRRLAILSTRFLRDPDGVHAHGVMSIEATLMELAS